MSRGFSAGRVKTCAYTYLLVVFHGRRLQELHRLAFKQNLGPVSRRMRQLLAREERAGIPYRVESTIERNAGGKSSARLKISLPGVDLRRRWCRKMFCGGLRVLLWTVEARS